MPGGWYGSMGQGEDGLGCRHVKQIMFVSASEVWESEEW